MSKHYEESNDGLSSDDDEFYDANELPLSPDAAGQIKNLNHHENFQTHKNSNHDSTVSNTKDVSQESQIEQSNVTDRIPNVQSTTTNQTSIRTIDNAQISLSSDLPSTVQEHETHRHTQPENITPTRLEHNNNISGQLFRRTTDNNTPETFVKERRNSHGSNNSAANSSACSSLDEESAMANFIDKNGRIIVKDIGAGCVYYLDAATSEVRDVQPLGVSPQGATSQVVSNDQIGEMKKSTEDNGQNDEDHTPSSFYHRHSTFLGVGIERCSPPRKTNYSSDDSGSEGFNDRSSTPDKGQVSGTDVLNFNGNHEANIHSTAAPGHPQKRGSATRRMFRKLFHRSNSQTSQRTSDTASIAGVKGSLGPFEQTLSKLHLLRTSVHKKDIQELSSLVCTQEMVEHFLHEEAVWVLKFSVDGQFMASAGGNENSGKILVWHVRLFTDAEDPPQRPRSTPHRRSMTTSGTPKELQEFGGVSQSYKQTENHLKGDRFTIVGEPFFGRKPYKILRGHTSYVVDLAWLRDNKVVSASMDNTVKVWNIETGECLHTFHHPDCVTCLDVHPLLEGFIVTGGFDRKLRMWSLQANRVTHWTATNHMVTSVRFAPDARTVVAGLFNGVCMLYSAEGLKYRTQFECRNRKGKLRHGRKVTGIEYSPDGTALLVTTNDSRMRLLSARDYSTICKYAGNINFHMQISASFDGLGDRIACGSEDGHVYIWRTHHDQYTPQINPKLTGFKRDKNKSFEHFLAAKPPNIQQTSLDDSPEFNQTRRNSADKAVISIRGSQSTRPITQKSLKKTQSNILSDYSTAATTASIFATVASIAQARPPPGWNGFPNYDSDMSSPNENISGIAQWRRQYASLEIDQRLVLISADSLGVIRVFENIGQFTHV